MEDKDLHLSILNLMAKYDKTHTSRFISQEQKGLQRAYLYLMVVKGMAIIIREIKKSVV